MTSAGRGAVRPVPGRRAAAVVVLSLVAACTSSPAEDIPFAPTTVPRVLGSAGLEEALDGFLAWVGDNALSPPPMPDGLRAHLEGSATTLSGLDFTAAEAIVRGSRVAVAVAGNDRVLFVEEVPESGSWEVVGAHLPSVGKAAWYGEGPRFVVVLGSDARPEGDATAEWRPVGSDPWRNEADSVHLLTANLDTRSGAIIGVTRHLLVPVPYPVSTVSAVRVELPAGSPDWLSSTMTIGGPEATVEAMRTVTGLPFEGYLVTQFGGGLSIGPGFIELVDAFGGLTITLAEAIDLFDTPVRTGFFPAGRQVLDGARALLLARERRAQPNGDLDRKYHGALIVHAALVQAQGKGWLAIPGLLEVMEPLVRTDLDAGALLTLAATALTLNPGAVRTSVVPARQATQDLTVGSCTPTDGGACPAWRDAYVLQVAGGFPLVPSPAALLFQDLADGRRDGFATLDQSDWPLGPEEPESAAIAESMAGFPDGANTVYLTPVDGRSAALGAATARRPGPILLLDATGGLAPATRAELTRLAPRRVIVVASAEVAPDAVLDDLRLLLPLANRVDRLIGDDDAGTALAIAADVFPAGVPLALVTTSAHAVLGSAAATATAAPLLLVDGAAIPDAVAAELARLTPRRLVVIGGDITDGVVEALRSSTEEVVRIGGIDESALSVALSQALFPETSNTIYVATGTDHGWWTAGTTAIRNDPGPLLLIAADAVPEAVQAEITRLGLSRVALSRIVVVAGPGEVAPEVIARLATFLEP